MKNKLYPKIKAGLVLQNWRTGSINLVLSSVDEYRLINLYDHAMLKGTVSAREEFYKIAVNVKGQYWYVKQ